MLIKLIALIVLITLIMGQVWSFQAFFNMKVWILRLFWLLLLFSCCFEKQTMASASTSSSSSSRVRRLPSRYEESGVEPPKKRRNTWISKYDSELVALSNEGRTDTEIAKILCLRHDADPNKITPRAVESRCRYLRRNGIAKFAPVNSSIDLRAVDLPRTCFFTFSCFYFSDCFQQGKMQLH